MKTIYSILFGILGGLLGAGLIWLVSSPPRGQPVLLRPPPTPPLILVHVDGAVALPGVYPLPEGSRVRDALDAAGGLADDADASRFNLAARMEDGVQLWVPGSADEETAHLPDATALGPAATPGSGLLSQPPGQQIEINSATQTDLESLPGIGPATALKIIAYREEMGPFSSIEEIMNVSGIGPATFEKIKGLITVGTILDRR